MKLTRIIAHVAGFAVLLLGLPLVGIELTGRTLAQFTEFPPLTRYVEHAGFSWPVFIGLALFILAVVGPFLIRTFRWGILHPSCPLPVRAGPFPLFGYFGLVFGIAAWILAWHHFPWFDPLQRFTFTPLWISYILVVNALTLKRTGRCMMTSRPAYFVSLFLASAVFWWFFEYLNRFVQNWYYAGIGDITPLQYFIFATLPFSTVLPAVLGTCELLQSVPGLGAGLDDLPPIRVRTPSALAWTVLLMSCAGLALLGIWPDYLFPLLWISPLAIIVSVQAIRGQETIFTPIRRGNWQRICFLALSALICGVFWEMWNFRSAARWLYAVPFVNRFHVFEMPLLGYSGYLPFGIECAVIGDLIAGFVSERKWSLAGICKHVNAVILIAIASYFLIAPGLILIRYLADPKIREPGIPQIAWSLHRSITPTYERWAKERMTSGKAANLQLRDVPSTEWPMFGSVFYLWATQTMQDEWDKDHSIAPVAPREYARATIDAATELVLDPVHHTWVKTHWGDKYMHKENVFFRAMIIAAITSHEKLLHDGKHLDVLRDQVETLSADLDASPLGVLDDYPDECYPIDVFASIACIRRADSVLGTDHSAFASRALRAFKGDMLDKRGMIPYSMDSVGGEQYQPSRGVGNSYVLIYAPELYPEQAKEWYRLYEKYFWQRRITAAGFREFPNDLPGHNWTYDVDAGPVIAGFSPAANAFGVAGCRVNGRFDRAYVLTAQTLAAAWPLPNGRLLGARILSNAAHAPYLGEAALLYLLTRQPAPGFKITTGGHLPGFVYIAILFFLGIGLAFIVSAVKGLRKWRLGTNNPAVPQEALQFSIWLIILLVAATALCAGSGEFGAIMLFAAQFLPRTGAR